jgi:serine/threonine-protein kinase
MDPQLGTLLYLADCYDQIGKTASAWASFRDAVEIAMQRHDDRENDARKRLQEIEPRLSRITINFGPGTPHDVEIRQDGQLVSSAAIGTAIPVDPGTHVIVATAPGFQDLLRETQVPAGPASVRIVIGDMLRTQLTATATKPVATPQQTTAPVSSAHQPAPGAKDRGSEHTGSAQRSVAYSLVGAGIVGIGLGTTFAVLTNGKVSDRDHANACSSGFGCNLAEAQHIRELTDDARRDATIANLGFAVGAAALIGGAVLLLAEREPAAASKAGAVRAVPWIGARLLGIGIGAEL